MNYFLDTNICAFILNGKFPHLSKRYSQCTRHEINIPSIVLFELWYGAEKSQKREQNFSKLRTFISELAIVPFCRKSAYVSGKIRADLDRAGTPIGGNDILIAATTLANNGILITNNTREFSRIDGLRVEDWVQG